MQIRLEFHLFQSVGLNDEFLPMQVLILDVIDHFEEPLEEAFGVFSLSVATAESLKEVLQGFLGGDAAAIEAGSGGSGGEEHEDFTLGKRGLRSDRERGLGSESGEVKLDVVSCDFGIPADTDFWVGEISGVKIDGAIFDDELGKGKICFEVL